jgi:hypothetical protein
MENTPKKKTMQGNISRGLFSLLDFLILEEGTDWLCPNVSNYHSMLQSTSQERRSHTMVWQCRPLFVPAWSG